MKALHVRHLFHRFGQTEVLADVGFDLHAGESLVLVGPSGCGKSTLLQVLAGLLQPSEIVMRSDFRGIGYVFQHPNLMPWMNARDNIALALKALGVPRRARRQQARAMALRLGLGEQDLDKYPHELSGGMQSRVALGRALVLSPDLLLLDEPFSALDVGLKLELYALLREHMLLRGSAMLLITHDLMEAVRLADRILLMLPAPGRLVREFALELPHDERSEAWVHRSTGELMESREVRIAFGMAAGAVPVVAHGAGRHTGCQV
ncbi:ABC transporter ATP-binding protein [Pseudomonas aeruginosa]|uniref:ATP-binding cassette domain-containing protein n=1 Tax=Pseudomonas aeruginosa TaxID=287 RepID=A0A6A9JYV6_PSEAI|nr:ATP-binding cassette domain-containing protein [Pseudomonas aeruginosa]AHA20436.1 ABC transporter ATP-binding protein [Pseudomonas aeruginosa PA1]AHA26235.1 ATPase component ABC-type transport system [Pseudomonas aeruginosa PA1R]ALE49953.1 ABC transporter ATP-binding protein [Pseudomonas aeruginosa]MDP5667502.1 ATP-binding cassette domain-containing protein [Pseudomonas aeruginosa]MUI60495.1 ATP-binding cassette domain-containing protein [Pseudomonas aeruginosa]